MSLLAAIVVSRGALEIELGRTLRRAGWTAVAADELRTNVEVVVVDPEAMGRDVLELCLELRRVWPTLPQVVVGDARLNSAVAALRAGAVDYIEREAPPEEYRAVLLHARLERSIQAWREARSVLREPRGELLGESQAMVRLRLQIDQAAQSEATAVVIGEAGTGKEQVARLLHGGSPRSHGPFVPVACGSIPATLAESELFGHVRGAFSGATAAHRGLILAANRGTLFLDDVGALPLDLQAKLLRALQERSVRPVGANDEISTDFRLIVSSTVDLDELVRKQRLRPDLYYRLAVLEIRLPPLREREFDVLVLAEHFLEVAAARIGKRVVGFTQATEEVLLRHRWRGNVRELRNAIDYAVAVARYDHLGEEDLPDSMRPEIRMAPSLPNEDGRWEAAEKRHIEAVLRSAGGNRSRAAEQLGIDRKTLHRKLARFGIDIPAPSRSGTRPKVDVPTEKPTEDQPKPYRFNFR